MDINDLQIRGTGASDFNDIMEVEKKSFGQDIEAELTADLLKDNTAGKIICSYELNKEEHWRE